MLPLWKTVKDDWVVRRSLLHLTSAWYKKALPWRMKVYCTRIRG